MQTQQPQTFNPHLPQPPSPQVRSTDTDPFFDTELRIEHFPGSGQRLKFNVYKCTPGVAKIQESDLLASAFVELDEISQYLDTDLECDLRNPHDKTLDEQASCLHITCHCTFHTLSQLTSSLPLPLYISLCVCVHVPFSSSIVLSWRSFS